MTFSRNGNACLQCSGVKDFAFTEFEFHITIGGNLDFGSMNPRRDWVTPCFDMENRIAYLSGGDPGDELVARRSMHVNAGDVAR